MASWQPRNERGQFRDTGLADQAARSGKSVRQLADEAARAGVSIDAMSKAFKRFHGAAESKKAMDAARKSMGMLTAEEERAAKSAQKAAALAAKNQAAENATSSAEAQAAAIGMVEAAALAAAAAVAVLAAALVSLMHKAIDVVTEMSILRAQFMALGKTPGIGAASLDSLKTLARTLPFAESKVIEWGQSLMMAKLQGRDLDNAVKAVAASAALMGDKGAASTQHFIETLARGGQEAMSLVQTIKMGLPEAQSKLADMGLRVEDIAKALNTTVAGLKNMRLNARQMAEAVEKALAAKAAGPLAEMMLSLPVLFAKAKEAALSLFDKLGPSVKPFLKAVQGLFAQFSKGSGPINALRKVVTEVFGTLFKYATMAVKAVSAFVKQNVTAKNIGGVWKDIKSAIGTVVTVAGFLWKIFGPIFKSPLFLKGIVTIFKMIAIVGLIVGGVLLAIGATMTWLAGMFAAGAGMIWGAIGYILDGIQSLSSGAWDAASNFIAGLVGGISGGTGAVVDAVKALASSAVGAIKGALGIASPSKVMERMGGFASAGMAEGLDDGQGKVGAASARMAGAATGGAASGLAGGARGGKTVTIHMAPGAVVIQAGGATITDEGLATALERILMAQGLGAT